jgi:hypothetical protein
MAESGVCSRLEIRIEEAMPGDPQECHQLARDCLRLAEEATSDPARQDHIALAHTWMELAHALESDNAWIECLSVDGSSVVPLQPRRRIRLRAA